MSASGIPSCKHNSSHLRFCRGFKQNSSPVVPVNNPAVRHCHLVGPAGMKQEAEESRQFSNGSAKMTTPDSEIFWFLYLLNQGTFL